MIFILFIHQKLLFNSAHLPVSHESAFPPDPPSDVQLPPFFFSINPHCELK